MCCQPGRRRLWTQHRGRCHTRHIWLQTLSLNNSLSPWLLHPSSQSSPKSLVISSSSTSLPKSIILTDDAWFWSVCIPVVLPRAALPSKSAGGVIFTFNFRRLCILQSSLQVWLRQSPELKSQECDYKGGFGTVRCIPLMDWFPVITWQSSLVTPQPLPCQRVSAFLKAWTQPLHLVTSWVSVKEWSSRQDFRSGGIQIPFPYLTRS